jgi:glutamate decarboxylase
MVHLSQVPNDKTIESPTSPIVGGFANFGLDEDDSFTASVYGSRYAAQDLPKTEMPEKEMPREVAYRMIKYAIPPLIQVAVVLPA